MINKTKAALAARWQRFAKLWRPAVGSLPKHISDQLARDIGMSRVELERHRFVWPSQSSDRPLI